MKRGLWTLSGAAVVLGALAMVGCEEKKPTPPPAPKQAPAPSTATPPPATTPAEKK